MKLGQRPKSAPGTTALRILDHARSVFNERGVGAVGIRDIARELGLSPGNVSYHFPTKEALVTALLELEHGENNALFDAPVAPLDFATVDRIVRTIMRRDLDNRWVTRDFVGLLVALPGLRTLHRRMQRIRDARVDHVIQGLIDGGLLDEEGTARAGAELRQQLFTQVFFWLPAAIVAAPERDPGERLDLHARAVLALFRGYCTPAGRRQLDDVLASAGGPGGGPRNVPGSPRGRERSRQAAPRRRTAARIPSVTSS